MFYLCSLIKLLFLFSLKLLRTFSNLLPVVKQCLKKINPNNVCFFYTNSNTKKKFNSKKFFFSFLFRNVEVCVCVHIKVKNAFFSQIVKFLFLIVLGLFGCLFGDQKMSRFFCRQNSLSL